jgi:hypothetical protein
MYTIYSQILILNTIHILIIKEERLYDVKKKNSFVPKYVNMLTKILSAQAYKSNSNAFNNQKN